MPDALQGRAPSAGHARTLLVRERDLYHPSMQPKPVTLDLDDGQSLAALLTLPPDAMACYVLAHGAGAGMEHPFMAACARELAELRIATLRYQFPYMQRGSRRPDAPAACHAAVRAAVNRARAIAPALPLVAGGRSFGGRMTSQAQALAPLPGVLGLVFLGFPLHAAQRPSAARARHLADIHVPLLFVQGTRDALAQIELLQSVTSGLGPTASLHLVDGADHSFHVPVRSGRKDDAVRRELLQAVAAWVAGRIPVQSRR
jgi:predicted alpha/beta-hydrolase family hydrolase